MNLKHAAENGGLMTSKLVPLLLIYVGCLPLLAFGQNCPIGFIHYPPLARLARIEGVVRIEFDISPDGSVTNVVAKSGHPILQNGTISTVNSWKFDKSKDAKHDSVEFHYHIKGEEGEKGCAEIRIHLPVIEISQAPPTVMYDTSY